MKINPAGNITCAVVFGICAISIGIVPDVSIAAPPSAAFGEYIGAGCPRKGAVDSCLPTTRTDHLRISSDTDARATVNVKIVFDKGQSCGLKGKATWTNGYFRVQADGMDPDKPCQLGLHIDGPVLTLEDPGAMCREVYCGTRGAFEGARFKKRPHNSNR